MRTIPLTRFSVGTQAVFSFKDPFNKFVQDMLKVNEDKFLLEVTSIISMRDHIKLSHRDPMSDVYKLVGISEIDYNLDLKNDVPLITFTYYDEYNSERLFRVPQTYVLDVSDASSVPYVNHGIYLALEHLPLDFDFEFLEKELVDFVKGRVGVNVNFSHITNSNITNLSSEEHERTETVRKNSLKVRKSLETRAVEAETELAAIHKRLKEKNIQLGS